MSKWRPERDATKLRRLRPKAGSWYEDRWPIVLFGLKFFALVTLLYGFLATGLGDQALFYYLKANAYFANAILEMLGQGTRVQDLVIQSSTFTMAVRRGCDAVEPTWLFSAAIISVHGARPAQRLVGIAVVTIVFQVVNLARLVTLFVIGTHWPSLFNSFHMELWPTFFIVLTILSFALWKKWISHGLATNAV